MKGGVFLPYSTERQAFCLNRDPKNFPGNSPRGNLRLFARNYDHERELIQHADSQTSMNFCGSLVICGSYSCLDGVRGVDDNGDPQCSLIEVRVSYENKVSIHRNGHIRWLPITREYDDDFQ